MPEKSSSGSPNFVQPEFSNPGPSNPSLNRYCGGGAAAVTLTTKLVAELPSPSLTLRAIAALPDCPAAGGTLTVRLAPAPRISMLASGTRVGLEDEPTTVRSPMGESTSD